MRRIKCLMATLLPLLILSACATVPKEIRNEAVEASFSEIRKNADAFYGKTVIWGGYILKTENLPNQSRLLVLQAPLTSRSEPKPREQSEGRFMAVFDKFMDPEIYKAGRKITVAGTVSGEEPVKIGDFEYPMIVIRGKFIRLWTPQEAYSGYYYYPPYYDPFWDGPFYPPYWGPYPYYW